jgi:DNA-binding response OmpR family regulator
MYREPMVVLDLNMGEMGGLDTPGFLRGDAEFKKVPIIVLTVEPLQRIIREVLTWKIDDYLIKPVNMKKRQERLAVHLGA